MHHTAPHLKALGATVTDLSVPGWISNVRNGQSLMDKVRCSEPPPDAVYVFDVPYLVTVVHALGRRTGGVRFP
jgi:hypothetical protein